jgi:hypothetical protein
LANDGNFDTQERKKTMPIRKISGMQKQRWPDEIFAAAETLLVASGPSRPDAGAIAAGLEAQFPDHSPTERTVRNWIKRGVLRPKRQELWNLIVAEAGEARHVLPVLAAVDARNRRIGKTIGRPIESPPITVHQAAVLARLGELAPQLDPIDRFEIARFYEVMERLNSTAWLDRFIGHLVAFEVWTQDGRDALEKAIGDGEVDPPLPFLSEMPPSASGLFVAIENGRQRLRAKGG